MFVIYGDYHYNACRRNGTITIYILATDFNYQIPKESVSYFIILRNKNMVTVYASVLRTSTKYKTNNTKYLQYSYPLGNIVANETIIVHKYIKKNSRSNTRATILHSFAILPCASFSFILVMKVLRIRLISLMSFSMGLCM